MPCYDSRVDDDRREAAELRDRLNAATKAACEMAKSIQRISPETMRLLSPGTRRWIREHNKLDKEHNRAR